MLNPDRQPSSEDLDDRDNEKTSINPEKQMPSLKKLPTKAEIDFEHAELLAQKGKIEELEHLLNPLIKNETLEKKDEANLLLIECYTHKIAELLRLAGAITQQKKTLNEGLNMTETQNEDFDDSIGEKSSILGEVSTLLKFAEEIDIKRNKIMNSMRGGEEADRKSFEKMYEKNPLDHTPGNLID